MITAIIHEGTPAIEVTFLSKVSSAMSSRLRSKSSSSAVDFEGTRKRRTKGEAFSLRIALKSPTREEGES